MATLTLTCPRPALAVEGSALAGPLLALVAFALFSLMDALVKVLSTRYPVPEIVLVNALITVLVVPTLALRRGGLGQLRTARPGLHLLRGLAGAATAWAAFHAYSRIPLADAYAIIFTTPLLVTLLSVPLLGEPVGWRRASAAGVGFLGVLIMLGGPTGGALGTGSLAAMLAACLAAVGIVMMRHLARTESTAAMALYSNLTVVGLMSLGLPFYWVAPSGADLLLFLLAGGLGTVALLLLISAYRRAAAVMIAPFQYSQMLWGLILGLLLWGDRPTLTVSIGALIIAGSGIFTFYREHRVARSAPATVALAPAGDAAERNL